MTTSFKQSKTNDKFIGVFPFEFEEKKGSVPESIHLIPTGQWEHDLYGPIIITQNDIKEFIQNFNAKVRKGVFITAGHEGFQELPAVGWITKVEQKDNGLWGTVEWNSEGKKLLNEKSFKFFSPEMCRDYEDPETHQYFRNVLTGGALTKSPYFKELEAIVFSEKKLKVKFDEKQVMKTLEEILALDVTALSDEDKAVLKENADKLTDEQKVTYASVLEVPKAEEPKPEETPKDEPKVEEPKPEEPKPEEPKNEEIQASEKGMVKISASELQILREKADKGVEAFKELERQEIAGIVSKMVFNEENKAGKFLPKSKDGLTAFVTGLNKAQRAEFSSLVNQLGTDLKFTEVGVGSTAVDGTAKVEVEAKVEAKMKANQTLKYSDALKEVMSENKGLEERYNDELSVKN